MSGVYVVVQVTTAITVAIAIIQDNISVLTQVINNRGEVTKAEIEAAYAHAHEAVTYSRRSEGVFCTA